MTNGAAQALKMAADFQEQLNRIEAKLDALYHIADALPILEAKVDAIVTAMQAMAEQGERMQQEGLLGMLKGQMGV